MNKLAVLILVSASKAYNIPFQFTIFSHSSLATNLGITRQSLNCLVWRVLTGFLYAVMAQVNGTDVLDHEHRRDRGTQAWLRPHAPPSLNSMYRFP
ncbi:uncharacterized protein G2W53_019838 [Senna tora]|uniref:Uncharacterized protein n=1 Tax=Senna tora TaxID=362788 RepID=A0A834U2K9_9FABA|nr:uncharacterized protein G2W53_019838 [Senna tora]